MKKKEIQDVFTKNIEELILMYGGKDVVVSAIIFVGSNHTIVDLDDNLDTNSDLDFIVLAETEAHDINTIYKRYRYDLTIINPLNFLPLIINAYQGFPVAGKIFSSLTEATIIRDTAHVAKNFIQMATKVYELFKPAVLPNFSINTAHLHNIKVNLEDTKKEDTTEAFFAYHRLSTHILNYISRLIYPFNMNGSYRGKVLKKHIKIFEKNESLREGRYFINDEVIEQWVEKFSPILEYNCIALELSPLLEKEILSNRIQSFFFGYDDILSTKTILFLTEEEFLKNKDRMNFKILSLSNIIPLFSKTQQDSYTDLLCLLSREYFEQNEHSRKKVLVLILKKYNDESLGSCVWQSIRTVLFADAIKEISVKDYILLEDFNRWLTNFDSSFSYVEESEFSVSQDIDEKLTKIFTYIKSSESFKETEIKASYTFFGIMKSLRINVDDIDL